MKIFEAIEQEINLITALETIAPLTKVEQTGTTTRLNPCPICNHNNCCTVYDNGNFLTYSCFSQAHPTNENRKNGGSIVKLVKEKFNISDNEVVSKLEELGLLSGNLLTKIKEAQKKGYDPTKATTQNITPTRPNTNEHPRKLVNNNNSTKKENEQEINSDDYLLNILDRPSSKSANKNNIELIKEFNFNKHLDERLTTFENDSTLLDSVNQYFKFRGFSDDSRNWENITKYSIYGYFDYKKQFRIGIPLIFNGFVYGIEGKSTEGETPLQDTFINGKTQKSNKIIFNLSDIEEARKENKPLILTESFFDSLCFIEQKRSSVGYMGKLKKDNLNYLVENIKDLKLISAFDNDDGGKLYYKELCEELERKTGIKRNVVKFNLAEGQDPNEFYKAERMNFITELKRCEEESEREHEEYLNKKQYGKSILGTYFTEMQKEIDPLTEHWKKVKFGFNGLDNLFKHLHHGLYVLGGISGMGKTTFTQQLMVNIARQGQKVLMFNLEQTQEQVISKIVALEHNTEIIEDVERNRLSHTELLSGTDIMLRTEKFEALRGSESFKRTNDRLIAYGNNIEYADMNECRTVEEIERYIKNNYIPRVQERPVIMIDYLQYLTTESRHATKKDSMDIAVKKLKNMSMRLGLPIFLISSLNREAYSEPVQTSSFKETGDIEYSADVIIGLHLEAIAKAKKGISETGEQLKSENEVDFSRRKKELARTELERYPRLINVSVLKNRWGRTYAEGFTFDYYTDGDIYREAKHFARLRKPTRIRVDLETQLRCYLLNDGVKKSELEKKFKTDILDDLITMIQRESEVPKEFTTEETTKPETAEATQQKFKATEKYNDVPF